MGLRVQVSLQFSDQEMYETFILPRREERTLNALAVRCLTAYYRSPEFRALVDDDVVEVRSTNDIIESMRSYVTMQDVLVGDLENTLNAGAEDFSGVLSKVNQKASDSGVTTENAGAAFKPKSKSQDKGDAETSVSMNQLSVIFDALTILASAIGNEEVKDLIDKNREGVPRLTMNTSVAEEEVTSASAVEEPAPVREEPSPEPAPTPEPVSVAKSEPAPEIPEPVSAPVKAEPVPEVRPQPQPSPVLSSSDLDDLVLGSDDNVPESAEAAMRDFLESL